MDIYLPREFTETNLPESMLKFIFDEPHPVSASKKDFIAAIATTTSPRNVSIFVSRFGLENGKPRSYRQLAEDNGITRVRVGQICSTLARKARMVQEQYVTDPAWLNQLMQDKQRFEKMERDLAEYQRTRLEEQLTLHGDTPIDKLWLSNSAQSYLLACNIHTIGELILNTESDLLRKPFMRRKTLNEIVKALAQKRLALLPPLLQKQN